MDEDLWERANRNLSNRSKPAVRHDHWLSGRVLCRNYGRVMMRAKHFDKGRVNFHFYRCNTYLMDRRSCPNPYVHSQVVEPVVWERLRR